jgi:hypothetical protein
LKIKFGKQEKSPRDLILRKPVSNPSPNQNEINSNAEHESARRTSLSPLRVVVSSTSKPKVNLNSNIFSNNIKKTKNLNII